MIIIPIDESIESELNARGISYRKILNYFIVNDDVKFSGRMIAITGADDFSAAKIKRIINVLNAPNVVQQRVTIEKKEKPKIEEQLKQSKRNIKQAAKPTIMQFIRNMVNPRQVYRYLRTKLSKDTEASIALNRLEKCAQCEFLEVREAKLYCGSCGCGASKRAALTEKVVKNGAKCPRGYWN